ncbi:MAG: DJ-1/PfpI family protein [Proteobacteria bacterium]|nr:DJ-1/PfpI family protein [Pseudomonadota bacterium]
MTTTIGIILFENAEELDWAGPWKVFTMATQKNVLRAEAVDARVVTIAEKREVRNAKGLRVLVDHTFEDAPDLDVLVVPGGEGTRTEIQNPVLIDYLRKAGERCTWVTSVCTGSMLLHGAGFAAGKRITTHWAFCSTLKELAPDATVLEGVRYVRDGNLVTAAGVSAGIDMALWLVGQIWGVAHARQTQRFMEYDPAPPYSADVQ